MPLFIVVDIKTFSHNVNKTSCKTFIYFIPIKKNPLSNYLLLFVNIWFIFLHSVIHVYIVIPSFSIIINPHTERLVYNSAAIPNLFFAKTEVFLHKQNLNIVNLKHVHAVRLNWLGDVYGIPQISSYYRVDLFQKYYLSQERVVTWKNVLYLLICSPNTFHTETGNKTVAHVASHTHTHTETECNVVFTYILFHGL